MTAEKKEDAWYSPGEESTRAAELRKKKARGEKLSREEAGFLGAVASRRATSREQREAEASGHGAEYKEAHRTESWMRGEETRAPEITKDDREHEQALRKKQAQGEKLTHEESGFLGGLERTREAQRE